MLALDTGEQRHFSSHSHLCIDYRMTVSEPCFQSANSCSELGSRICVFKKIKSILVMYRATAVFDIYAFDNYPHDGKPIFVC
jgi:hypothetical protein